MVKPEDEGMADDGAEKVKETGGGGLSKPKGTHEGAEAHNARFSPRIRRKLWDPSPESDESCGARAPNQKLWSPSSESVVVKPELRIVLLQ